MCISLFKWGTPTHLANKITYTRGMNICARAKIKIRKTKQQIAIILWWFLHLCLFELKFTSLDITSVNLFWLLAAQEKTIKIKKFWWYFFFSSTRIYFDTHLHLMIGVHLVFAFDACNISLEWMPKLWFHFANSIEEWKKEYLMHNTFEEKRWSWYFFLNKKKNEV